MAYPSKVLSRHFRYFYSKRRARLFSNKGGFWSEPDPHDQFNLPRVICVLRLRAPRNGVIMRPLGNDTDALSSYHRCNSLGTSSGTPGTRSGRPLIEFAPPLESGKTKPLWAVNDPATRQPPPNIRCASGAYD
jgi:hypothetical protein